MGRKTGESESRPAHPDGAPPASDQTGHAESDDTAEAPDHASELRAEEAQEDLREYFDSEDESWMADIREAETPQSLGTLGPYELLEEVSRGGQGIVYRALQGRRKRQVAVKRLIAGALATDSMRRRFYREVEAASALDHPNIVNVHGMRVIDDQPVLAMQWIEGVPITDWVGTSEGAKRSLLEILEVFAKVCDAVHHAHQRGVIHRDLKPSNILVDGANEPHVLDFGLAKTANPEGGLESAITLTAQFLGTPAYAAPEQFHSGPDHVDVRTDGYSLGVILYQMLTERLPYKIEGSIADVVSAINTIEPSRPSAVGNRADREIDAIVLKSLAKRPEGRYQSVEAFGADIRRYLNGEPVLAHPPNSFYQLGKLLRRHKVAVSFAATVIVLLAGIAIVLVISNERIRIEEQRADVAKRDAMKAQRMTNQVNSFVEGVLDESSPLRHGGSIGHFDLLRQASDWAAFSLISEPKIEARVRLTIAEYYGRVWMWPEAEPHVARALTIYNRNEPDDAEILYTSKLLHAIVQHQAGRPDAIHAFREAENAAYEIKYDWLTAQNNPWACRAIMWRALAMLQTNGPEQAEAALEAAEDAVRRAEQSTAASDAMVGLAYQTTGTILSAMERNEEAESRYRQAMRYFERAGGAANVYRIACLTELASVLERLGREDELRAARYDTLDLIRREFGESWTAYAFWRLADNEFRHGDHAAAARYMQSSLAWFCREIGDRRPELRASLELITERSVVEPPPHLEPAVCQSVVDVLMNVRFSLDASTAHEAGKLLAGAASIIQVRDGPGQAVPLYRAAVELLGDVDEAPDLMTIESFVLAANGFMAMADYDSAAPLLEKSCRRLQDALGRTHRRTEAARRSLADLYRLTDRPEKAREVERVGADTSTQLAH